MKKYLLLLTFVLTVYKTSALVDSIYVLDFTKNTSRELFKAQLINDKIKSSFRKELNKETEKNYLNAFWASELLLYKDSSVYNGLGKAINCFDERTAEFQRALLQSIFTLYPNSFEKEIKEILEKTDSPKIFAMCSVILLNNPINKKTILERLFSKFINYQSDPILNSLLFYLSTGEKHFNKYELREILSENILPNSVILFSLQKENRDNVGRLIIRNRDGRFLRNNNGKIFSVPQLARSITNLPSFLTNGNTPVGIYSIQGFGKSDNVFIGPTTNLQMVLPFESAPFEFFHNLIVDTYWSESIYEAILPSILKNNRLIKEAFYAGKAGRTEIIAHGTTIDPSYYINAKYYPYTPSLGCLCTYEQWNKENGIRELSNQQELVNKLESIGFSRGFLVVLQIGGEDKAITEEELNELLEKISWEN